MDITVPDLAKACAWTRWKALRRLREAGVVLRRRGTGTLRQHYWLTIADLVATPDGEAIFAAIRWNRLLVTPPAAPSPDDDDEDDERPIPMKGRDGVWRG